MRPFSKNITLISKELSQKVLIGLLVSLFLIPLTITNSYADVSEKDFRVLTRALSFIHSIPPGETEIAILYNPNNSESKAEALQLEKHLKNKVSVGKITLSGKRYPISQIPSLNNKKVVYLTQGTEKNSARILKSGTITISNNLACTENNQCVLAAKTDPKVQIHVSREAAAISQTRFDSTFRMMITEK